MDKKRVLAGLTAAVLGALLVGILCYIFYINSNAPKQRGTLVRAFSQKVNEYCL